ncbi:MAG: Smc, chromosome segregation ATPase, chromosome segregation protein [Candidatus Parcubacteria bacterium]|nr:Smc, chromosome segregation ATPase, chromosome segregation protein [Candidatus Parcubacteria bacterium]
MHLKSLEISGFKSFAKKATLSFTSSITGIVGPNGSGKSNTAEAFRFVLGEQSIKSLRGKRGEDMIWNGGSESGAGRANRATVSLVFDNSPTRAGGGQRMFPSIDFDEVKVERVVNRDNSNEYYLNGSQVRLRDIMELMAGAHVGATGHHIISQGEADRILTASIRERREIIEDALGLKIHQWKKLESIRKLERTEENMKQVESLRREIAPHIKFLRKQVEKIEKAEEMRRELISIYKEYFAQEEAYLCAEKSRLEHELGAPKKELASLDHELERAKAILTASKNKDQKSEEVIALETRLAGIRADKDAIMRELGRLEGEINANRRAIEKEKEKQKRDEFKTVYLKDLEDVVGTLSSLPTVAEIIQALKSFITRHRGVSDSSFIGEAEKEIATLMGRKADEESRLKGIGESESKYASEYEALKRAIEKEKDTNRDAEKDVFRIIARQNEVRGVIASLTGQWNALSHEEESFKRELGEAGNIAGREAVNYSELSSSSAGASAASSSRADQADKRHHIEKLKIRIEDAGAGGGSEVLKEYKETEERDAFLARELEDLGRAKEELLKLVAELDARIDYEFKSGILKINEQFQSFFTLMFGGGKAELTVIRETKRRKKSDAEELSGMLSEGDIEAGGMPGAGEEEESGPEGLDVNVSLPRKKVKGLMMLSGGERALTSIALLFAISQVNPPPFIILDETDAALDEANSRKYGDMIESLSKHSQLILITHNRETMSRAGVIYGVTMGADGASKLLSIAFEDAVKVAK